MKKKFDHFLEQPALNEFDIMTPVLSIIGKSNSGKTTLIEKLIPVLKSRGYRIGVIKHTHHTIETDSEHKDSRRHQKAGAETVVIASKDQIALVKQHPSNRLADIEPYFSDMDLIITEGYKSENRPKIEVIRSATGKRPVFSNTNNTGWIAFVSDLPPDSSLPCFQHNDIEEIADFIDNTFLKTSTDQDSLSDSGPD